jgi:hypothetical protein
MQTCVQVAGRVTEAGGCGRVRVDWRNVLDDLDVEHRHVTMLAAKPAPTLLKKLCKAF